MTELGNAGADTVGTSTAGGGESSSASVRAMSSMEKFGDRTRFSVELRPGETTIVSWKKLLKDAAKAEGGGGASAVAGPAAGIAAPEVPTALKPCLASGQPAADGDALASNRFSAVIEKIERLYMGKDSSDDEDLNDIPDDDQYDTEDSFIDDVELDEYFQVDKSKTKHDGFFVNKGTLEKVIEPSEPPNRKPRKRRKEMAKAASNSDDGQRPCKHMKEVTKDTEKSLSAEKRLLPASEAPSVKYFEETKFQNHLKIAANGGPLLDPSMRIPHDDGSLSIAETSDSQKTGIILAKNISSNVKESSGNGDRTDSMHKSQSLANNVESEIVIQPKDKNAMRERIDLNLPDTKHSMVPVKNFATHKKEGSSVKSKANSVEKAVRELEKMVSELRPPAQDAQDGDSSSQYIKRRLPREVKQKLAKVARLAHASYGMVSNELLSRLMGILGHICQVRTLKRHLKVMVTTSLSAKHEKDEKFQRIKNEVVEMVNVCVPSLISKATEQQSGGSSDLLVSPHSEKAEKGQLFMNATLEDKICDLYDNFVDGLDEDAAPQVRKLYAELAELWPKGVMDNHGIRRGICRAKERRRTLNDKNKELEKIDRKKLVPTNINDTIHMNVKVTTDPNIAVVTQQNWFSFGAGNIIFPLNTALTFTSTNVPHCNQSKQEKVVGTYNSSV